MKYSELVHAYSPRHEDYDDDVQDEIIEVLSSAKQAAEYILNKTDEETQLIAKGKKRKHTFDGVDYAIARALCFALQAAQNARALGEAGLTTRDAAIGVIVNLLNQLPIKQLEGVLKELDPTL